MLLMGVSGEIIRKILDASSELVDAITGIKNKRDSKSKKYVFSWAERRKLSKFIDLCGRAGKSKKAVELLGIIEEITDDYPKIKEMIDSRKWLLGFDEKGNAEKEAER